LTRYFNLNIIHSNPFQGRQKLAHPGALKHPWGIPENQSEFPFLFIGGEVRQKK